MASTFVAAGGNGSSKDQHPARPGGPHQMSPKGSFKKAWPPSTQPPPTTPSCDAQGHHHHQHHQEPGGALPKCVCAPATHARSFKCRLHRSNSHGHSPPTTPPSSGSGSSTRTVEAQ